jgi:hypothetical protein
VRKGLIMEFDGDAETYERVTALLGIDVASGEGEWPAGLLFHSGGAKPGGWIVSEVWASQEDQERFMAERLGPALREAGVDDPPSRVEWFDLAAFHKLE